MGMPDLARRYTVEEVLAFPSDGNRYELVHGELLVSPAPRVAHQVVLGRFHIKLASYLEPLSSIAQVFLSPADISWGPEDLVQPDIFVVPTHEISGTWKTFQTLLLAVEVLSPSTARYDRITKRRRYQEQGVVTYFAVDADARLVEVWHPRDDRPEIVTDRLTWRVSPQAPELVIELDELFRGLPE